MILNTSVRFQTNWIISRNDDLVWFIFSSLSAYCLIFMFGVLEWNIVSIWFIWVMLVDSPHFFGTYSRTYLDKQELRDRKPLMVNSLLVFLVGPFFIGISYILYVARVQNYELPWFIFLGLFSLWAYWHVVRQHYGFLMLYKRKGDEKNILDYRLDSAILYIGLITPFLVFIVREPEAKILLNQMLMPLSIQLTSGVTGGMEILGAVILITSTALYAYRQLILIKRGHVVNVSKLLFLLSIIPLHVFIGYSDFILNAGLLGFGAFVTVTHDLQYFAIVWFYSKNKYRVEGSSQKFGLAATITKSLPVYLICAISMGVLFRLFGCGFQLHPGCMPIVSTSEAQLFGSFGIDRILIGIFLGIAMHHYILDQFIWKTGKDKKLKKDLRIEE